MATQRKNRRGTSAEHANFTGAVGEVTVDTDESVLVVHDGVTQGGRIIGGARQLIKATGAWVARKLGDILTDTKNVKDYGAIGDGVTDDTAAIQRALDAGKNVFFPEPDVAYLVTASLVLRGGHKIQGSSKSDGVSRDVDVSKKGIYGDMAVNGTPIFKLGDGADGTLRKMSFKDIYAYCLNGSVVKSRLATEFSFVGCELRSRFYHCIDTEQSYVYGFYNCAIGSSGTIDDDGVTPTFAIRAMDNSNGAYFTNCRISGGSAGGVATIGRSYNVKLDSCIFESTKYGVYVGEDPSAVYGGQCTNFAMIDCNFEQCFEPFQAGRHYAVTGLRLVGNYFSNSVVSSIPDRDTCIQLGRVESATIENNVFELDVNEYVFNFIYDGLGGSFLTLHDSRIVNNFYKTVTNGYIYKTSDFASADQVNRLAENYLVLDEIYGEVRSYTTSLVTNTGEAFDPTYIKIAPVSALGGIIERVEILEANGALDGNLFIGYLGNQAENMNLDLSSISVIDGYVDVTSSLASKYIRADDRNLRLRCNAGTTGNNFKLRITYKS